MISEKMVSEKTVTKKTVNEKMVSEKTVTKKTVNEKTIPEKMVINNFYGYDYRKILRLRLSKNFMVTFIRNFTVTVIKKNKKKLRLRLLKILAITLNEIFDSYGSVAF